MVPVMIFRSVDFPAPFTPTMPVDVPDASANVTSRSASKRVGAPRRPPVSQ
jgi:hypothetical protein